MTQIEDACRWSIVYAYCINWRLHTHYRRRRMLDYARALGLTLIEDNEDIAEDEPEPHRPQEGRR